MLYTAVLPEYKILSVHKTKKYLKLLFSWPFCTSLPLFGTSPELEGDIYDIKEAIICRMIFKKCYFLEFFEEYYIQSTENNFPRLIKKYFTRFCLNIYR